MQQQSLIGGKFFAVMFWLIADGLFAVGVSLSLSLSVSCQTAIYAINARRQHVALITVATVARKMLQQLVLQLLKHWPLIVACLLCWTWCLVTCSAIEARARGSWCRQKGKATNACTYKHMYISMYAVQQLPHLVATSWTASVCIMRGLRVVRCPVDTNVHFARHVSSRCSMYLSAVALSFLPHVCRVPIALLATHAHRRYLKVSRCSQCRDLFLPADYYLFACFNWFYRLLNVQCPYSHTLTHTQARTLFCSSNTFQLSQQCNGKFLCLLQSFWLVFSIDFKTAAFLGLHCVTVNWISHRNC